METQLLEILRALLGLILGGAIGLGFGLIQNAAYRRHEMLQEHGKLTNGWKILPGSARRVAYLLAALALVQFVSPALFAGGSQWWVTAGLVGGYGSVLFRQIRQRRESAGLAPVRHG
jgi:RsiW-degrading membrane proteinase PrsW (M82 family)